MTQRLRAPLSDPVPLPTTRPPGRPFDPPAELDEYRSDAPIRRMRYPDGHVGWLVTGYDLARAVLADPRFSIRLARQRSPVEMQVTVAFRKLAQARDPSLRAGGAGNFLEMDPPRHTRFRRLLASEFTLRRMEQLRARVDRIVHEHLDRMEAAGPPVDLVTAFALPVPSLAICELLGVPYRERADFHRYSTAIEDLSAGVDEIIAGYRDFDALMRRVVAALRPGQGLLGRLAATGELTEEELVGVGKLLVAAGHHTTKNMLALGTFALLYDRSRWECLVRDPSSVTGVVEELLRYLTTFQLGAFARTATEDVELDGVLIRAGESVTVSLAAANRDPAKFTDPHSFDPDRQAVGHLAFGHGIHMCLGQHLARVELQAGLAGLARRFPDLRLAIAVDEVAVHPGHVGQAGVYELPVTWGPDDRQG